MVGKRERLASLLDRAGVLRALLWARGRARTLWLPILTYHRVSEPSAETKFDPDVIDATPDQFDRQLELLARYFSFVGSDEVADHVAGRSTLPRNALMITFDDGYRDCLDTALPILTRHGAKAVFFIATSYVGDRRVYWWDRIRYALANSDAERIELAYPEPLSLDLDGEARGELTRLVKTHRGLDVDRFLDDLYAACDVSWDRALEQQLADELVMTWDDVRSLRDAGMDIQSHTRTHRVLGTLLPDDLDAELGGSREELRAELKDPIRALAYPVGYSISDRPELVGAVERAGYEVGFTNATGTNALYRGIDPFDLSRDAMDVGFSDSYFLGMLAIPALSRVRA